MARQHRTPATRNVIAHGARGVRSLLSRFSGILDDLEPGETFNNYVGRQEQVVQENVRAITALVEPYDAFDIIDLIRQRETAAFNLTGYRESESDSLPAVIELVALVLVARGTREPDRADGQAVPPNRIIEELHRRGSTILTMGTFAALEEGKRGTYGPLTMLALEYRSHEVNVRSKQYARIRDHFDQEFFGSEAVSTLILDILGFTFEDFKAVRDAIDATYMQKLEKSYNELGEVTKSWEASGRVQQEESEIERGRLAASDVFFYPGKRASFTAMEIATWSGVDLDRVEKVLQLFSTPFDRTLESLLLVQGFLNGRNVFARAALLVDHDGNYITLSARIGTDCFRQVVEGTLKTTTAWNRFDKHRARVSERLSIKYLQELLDVSVTHAGLKYFRPKDRADPAVLGRHATNVTDVADQVESDALFLVDDIAICVEVKARSVTTQAKQGNVKKLVNDLKKTVGEANNQALRLETLIKTNSGLWLEDRSWMDLSHVREIRSIVVCLEDMGPLGTALDELVRSQVIQNTRFPWIVSLHDLAVITKIVERPPEFLLYLRRRSESDVSMLYQAMDELDLFMLFVNGGLYVEPDPEKVYRKYPASGRPSAAAQKRYAKNAIPTRVHTHTDPLDAWIYYKEGSSAESVAKPTFSATDRVLAIVDYLLDGHKPGWLRFSADLLNLGSGAQKRLGKDIRNAVAKTRHDSRVHSILHCYAGSWGFPTLFVLTRPSGMSLAQARQRLTAYMAAKKHQLRSDRSLGLLVDSNLDIVTSVYMNSPWREDSVLDAAGNAIGILPVGSTEERTSSRRRRNSRRRRHK